MLFGTVKLVSAALSGILPRAKSLQRTTAVEETSHGCAGDALDDDESNMLEAAVIPTFIKPHNDVVIPHPSAADFRIVEIVLDAGSEEASSTASDVTIRLLWVPYSSSAVVCPFLMQLAHYKASIALDARPGTSIRTMFAVSSFINGEIRKAIFLAKS